MRISKTILQLVLTCWRAPTHENIVYQEPQHVVDPEKPFVQADGNDVQIANVPL